MQKAIGVIKNGLLYLALFLCINYNAMEPEGDWKDPLMIILSGEHQTAALAQALDSSKALLQETRDTIKELAQKYLEAKTIDDATQIIGTLTHLDEALKNRIMDTVNFNSLITYLAKRFSLKEKVVLKKMTQYVSAPLQESKQSKKKNKNKFKETLQHAESWTKRVFANIAGEDALPPKELKQKLEKNAEFVQLPKEIQNHIFSLSLQGYSATSLEEAIHIIKTLSRVNKELNATIHAQAFFLQLLNVLAQKFKVDFSTVCNTFGTPQAQQCIAQQQLFDLCFNPKPSKETLSDLLNDLLKQGAQLEFMCIYNKQEMTPLMLACCTGNNNMVNRFLKAGANANKQNSLGFSALMYCCVPTCGQPASFAEHSKEFIQSSIELLLEDMNTEVNLQNYEGDTALILAVKNNDIKNVKELVEYSTVMLKNKHGQSAMDIAQERNNQSIINILKKKLAQENSSQQKKSKLKKFFK